MGQPQPRNQTDLPINKAHIKNALKVIEHLIFEHPIFLLRRDDHLVQLHMCRMVYFQQHLALSENGEYQLSPPGDLGGLLYVIMSPEVGHG